MSLSYRMDPRGGFTVGDTETGRASYAEPGSKNAVDATDDPQRTARGMRSLQAAMPQSAHSAWIANAPHWDRLHEGERDGSTKTVDEAKTFARVTEADNQAKAATSTDSKAEDGAVRIANTHTAEHRPPDHIALGPRVPRPGDMFATRSSFVAQYHANRQADTAAPTPDVPAAVPAATPQATPAIPRPALLDMMKAALPPERQARVQELAQSRAVALARTLSMDADYA